MYSFIYIYLEVFVSNLKIALGYSYFLNLDCPIIARKKTTNQSSTVCCHYSSAQFTLLKDALLPSLLAMTVGAASTHVLRGGRPPASPVVAASAGRGAALLADHVQIG